MTATKRRGLIYGSVTGKTEYIAEDIVEAFLPEFELELVAVSSIIAEDLRQFELAICGIPTWDIGELEYGWVDIYEKVDDVDLTGVQIAMFGLGDQSSYADTYQDAMGILYKKLIERNAKGGIGFASTEGHDFEKSLAVIDSQFCGLALDEDNQDELSRDRIAQWAGQVKMELMLSRSSMM